MKMIKHLLPVGVISVASLLPLTSAIPPVQASEEPESPATTEPEMPLEQPPEPGVPADPQPTLVCPPGQFASAFSDVLPEHWAYTAVNQLASVPPACFDRPE